MTQQEKILTHVNKLLEGKNFKAEYEEGGDLSYNRVRVEIDSDDYTNQLRSYLMRKAKEMHTWFDEGTLKNGRRIVFIVKINN